MSERTKKMDLTVYNSGVATLVLIDKHTKVAVTQELSADELELLATACEEASDLVREIARENIYAEMVQRSEAGE